MVGLSVYLTIELTELLTDQIQCQRRVKGDPRFLAGASGRMKLLLTKMGKAGRAAGMGTILDQFSTYYV